MQEYSTLPRAPELTIRCSLVSYSIHSFCRGCCILYYTYTIYTEHNRTWWRTSMNERTNTLLYKKYTSHTFILERVGVGCVWEVSWKRGQTATYWPQVLLAITALLSHSGWAAQPWVTEVPSPLSGAGSLSAGNLSPTANRTDWPKPSLAPGYIIVWRPPASCGRTHLPLSPNSTTSIGQGDIPIFSTGCTCFAVLLLFHTGASLDWRLGRRSIYNRGDSYPSAGVTFNVY